MNLNNLVNLFPQNIRNNVRQALQKALQTVDPTTIKTRDDAIRVLQGLKQNGLPSSVIDKVDNYLNNPLANPILGALGVNKQDFKNGLQSICQPDNPSVMANTFPLLQGIDQLK